MARVPQSLRMAGVAQAIDERRVRRHFQRLEAGMVYNGPRGAFRDFLSRNRSAGVPWGDESVHQNVVPALAYRKQNLAGSANLLPSRVAR